ncbi:MAG: hypothetical protein AAF449_22470 [Myxococcota bacterium]
MGELGRSAVAIAGPCFGVGCRGRYGLAWPEGQMGDDVLVGRLASFLLFGLGPAVADHFNLLDHVDAKDGAEFFCDYRPVANLAFAEENRIARHPYKFRVSNIELFTLKKIESEGFEGSSLQDPLDIKRVHDLLRRCFPNAGNGRSLFSFVKQITSDPR